MDDFGRDDDDNSTERTRLLSTKEKQEGGFSGGFDQLDGERLLHILVSRPVLDCCPATVSLAPSLAPARSGHKDAVPVTRFHLHSH